eukprot:GFUD01022383.1.p1 GENE.GFUD01022383.1~~GFUD01022383.1.p1  ORF type:complete len:445 (-),score=107.02 GFUD01022383.1:61-1395(-)
MGKLQIFVFLVIKTATTKGYGQKQSQTPPEKSKNFEELYLEGKEAYLDNNYKDCVTKLEAAIQDYQFYTDTVSKCKLKCSKKSHNFSSVLKNSPDIVPFEKLVHETLCVMKCKQKSLSKERVENIGEKTRTDFEEKKPYDFLQLCYYQRGAHQDAANAAFTNLVYNSDHETMRANLKFYMALPEVDENGVKNLESPDYVEHYLLGTDQYRSEDWAGLIASMEESLKKYLLAEEFCRVNCDKPFDMGWYPDFKSSVANHFTFCLKCKMNCAQNLNNFNGEFMDDLIPSFYHYLQFAYFKVGKIEMASQCTGTYLYLNPDHQDMQGNALYYKDVEGVKEKWFLPREEAVTYVERDEDEQALLDYIESNFVFTEEKEEEENNTDIDTDTDTDIDSSEDAADLHPDEFIAKWSVDDEKFVLEEKNSDLEDTDFRYNQLTPPPIVKFSW